MSSSQVAAGLVPVAQAEAVTAPTFLASHLVEASPPKRLLLRRLLLLMH